MEPRQKAEHEAAITRAIMRLGSARREKLDKVDFERYADGLRQFSAVIVARVCDELGDVAPQEFQPRFPPLHVIRELCIRAESYEREKRLALKAPDLEARFPPLPPDKWAEIKARFHAVLQRKVMR